MCNKLGMLWTLTQAALPAQLTQFYSLDQMQGEIPAG